MDTAVVENQIHAGELLPCLFRLDIQFYHMLVTYKQSQLVTTSCLTIFLYTFTQLLHPSSVLNSMGTDLENIALLDYYHVKPSEKNMKRLQRNLNKYSYTEI